MGSVFSPYYFAARRRGAGDPADHCAVNVALYGNGPRRVAPRRWAMTERRRSGLARDAATLAIGPSRLTWDGDGLTIDLDELAVPLPRRIRGRVRLRPQATTDRRFAIDGQGRHHWWPIAPVARVELDLVHPALRWAGDGYLDCNAGQEPLERGFREWAWCRAPLEDGAAVLYDTVRRDASTEALALRFDRAGRITEAEPPPLVNLPSTGWRVRRRTRADPGHPASVAQTLEDTPFYARSLVDSRLFGQPVRAVHESLALDRFAAGWVRTLLPFRMPRALR